MSGEIVVCPRLPQALLPFALSVEEPIKTRDADTAKTTDFANRSGGEYHLQRRPGFFAQPVVFAVSAAQALLPFASSVEEPIRTRVADTTKATDFANRSGGSTTFNVGPGLFAQPMVGRVSRRDGNTKAARLAPASRPIPSPRRRRGSGRLTWLPPELTSIAARRSPNGAETSSWAPCTRCAGWVWPGWSGMARGSRPWNSC